MYPRSSKIHDPQPLPPQVKLGGGARGGGGYEYLGLYFIYRNQEHIVKIHHSV